MRARIKGGLGRGNRVSENIVVWEVVVKVLLKTKISLWSGLFGENTTFIKMFGMHMV